MVVSEGGEMAAIDKILSKKSAGNFKKL